MNVKKLRFVVKDCLEKHLYDSAIFFSDKLVSLSRTSDSFAQSEGDLYLLAQSYFLAKHFRRSLHVLRSHDLISKNKKYLYLAAKCLSELKSWKECTDLLRELDVENVSFHLASETEEESNYGRTLKIESALCYLNGKAYEELGNRNKARQWYISSLKIDPFCYESFERLIDYHMLNVEEEKFLLNSLNFDSDETWLNVFYSMRLKQFQDNASPEDMISLLDSLSFPPPSSFSSSSSSSLPSSKGNASLISNNDVLLCRAENCYQRGQFDECFALTTDMLEKDPYYLDCLPYHVACALELKQKNVLFIHSHKLVNEYPNKAVSWFAVGCYYYCIKQFDQARRYFSKSTQLDESFVFSWLGFGLAYSAQDEMDQAINAYRTALRYFPGCHIPYLYMAMDYRRSNNLSLAEEFLQESKNICTFDPLIFNELGIIAFTNNNFDMAEKYFEECLRLVSESEKSKSKSKSKSNLNSNSKSNLNLNFLSNEIWSSSIVNYAHTLRKKKKYSNAIEHYEKALFLSPKSSSIFSALGFTYHLMGKTGLAADYYHKSLALKPKDSFVSELLYDALKEECTA